MNRWGSSLRMAGVALALAAAGLSAPAAAQPTAQASAAVAGTYDIDARHAAVVARVLHQGFSYSIFRFNTVSGELVWDPANPGASSLNATVDPASIDTPVAGFAEEIAGDRFLKAAQFPTATFVSTAFRQTDASHGQVDGNLTLMGVTKPVTFDVELIGAGPTQRAPKLGVHATTSITPVDFGLPAMLATPIELVLDVEFGRRQ